MSEIQRFNINDKLYMEKSDLDFNRNIYRLILKISNEPYSSTIGIPLTDEDLTRLEQKIADIKKQNNKNSSKVDYTK